MPFKTHSHSKRGILIFIFTLIIGSAVVGCSSQRPQASMPAQPPAAPENTLDLMTVVSDNDQQRLAQESSPKQTQERMILRDATLNITIRDVAGKTAEIDGMASEMGGWIVSSNMSQSRAFNGETLTQGNITIRVPAQRLSEAMTRIKHGAETINSENVTGRDVTQQYVDLSSRQKNLESAEEQLQTIMDKAVKIDDVLTVYNELVRIRGEIETVKGQLQYFDQAADFSSISVTLNPIAPSPVTTQTTGWNPAKTAESAFSALIAIGQSLVDLLITLVILVLSPVLVLGIPTWLIFRRVRKMAQPSTLVVAVAAASTPSPSSSHDQAHDQAPPK